MCSGEKERDVEMGEVMARRKEEEETQGRKEEIDWVGLDSSLAVGVATLSVNRPG
jgi:hypothetical protein